MAYLGTPIDTTNQFQSLQGKRFSGNGSTTAFTLDVAPGSTLDIEVYVENVRQDPNSAYSLSGTTLTFSAAPSSGTNNIYVIHQAKSVGTIDVPNDSVTANSIVDDAVESEHLNDNIISGQTALAANPATDDEFLISDAGTIKRIDAQFFQNTPAFEAVLSSDQAVSDNTLTKVAFNSETFDTDGKYDNSTNYRFTPTIAGKYFVYSQINGYSGGDSDLVTITLQIRKNGSVTRFSFVETSSNPTKTHTLNCSATVVLDDNDYVEIFASIDGSSGGGEVIQGTSNSSTIFGAYKLIGA